MGIGSQYRDQSRMRAVMSINSVNGERVNSRSIEVLPVQIRSFGMQFITKLDLPAQGRYTIGLALSSRHYRRELTALVVWKREAKDGYVYGCSFQGGQRLHMSVRHSWEEERAASNEADNCTIYDKYGDIRVRYPHHGSIVDVTG